MKRSELALALNQIGAERSLPREIVTKVVESAIVQSYRKYANVMNSQNVAAVVDIDSGHMRIFVEKEVVEEVQDDRTEVSLADALKQKPDAVLGDCIMVDVTPKDFGRIAAQNAKQLIVQKLREAERDFQYNQFIEREGEIVRGMVQSVTSAGVVVNLGRIEATLPRKEQIPGEKYEVQQYVRAYITEVKRTGRGPQVTLSRTHKNFLRRLLEIEVPEIANGLVEIKSIIREPGARSKIAVAALQPNVDPVGACIGQRGARIQNISNELHGEKIDVIEWSADPTVYIAKALGPAKVMAVHPVGEKSALVIVPNDQLSLAIGREGQNARLAARLTGWRIDIKSSSEALGEALDKLSADADLQAWVGEDIVQALPSLRELLVRQRALPTPLTPDEFILVKRLVDSVHAYQVARQSDSHKAKPITREAQADDRQQARRAALAAIPQAAYGMPIEELGLSPRVAQHIIGAGIVSVGQLLEHGVRGDEGFLAIEGIGPKALNEIKQALEKVVGQWKAAPQAPAAGADDGRDTPSETATPSSKVEETTEEAQQYFIEAMSEGDEEGDDGEEDLADEAAAAKARKKEKKGKKPPKDRLLVYDEELGRVVTHHVRKPRRYGDPDDLEF
ncbi:MAG: transcription termination factor NusA [Thermoflexales bacterium]|nr:transcription termination factor NusA [Thermoflexales bacterium]MDW8350492.1 transcription termination factor NusA [Anaerolineae bacterium]